MSSLVDTVLPAPDSPLTSIDWSAAAPPPLPDADDEGAASVMGEWCSDVIIERYARSATAYTCGGRGDDDAPPPPSAPSTSSSSSCPSSRWSPVPPLPSVASPLPSLLLLLLLLLLPPDAPSPPAAIPLSSSHLLSPSFLYVSATTSPYSVPPASSSIRRNGFTARSIGPVPVYTAARTSIRRCRYRIRKACTTDGSCRCVNPTRSSGGPPPPGPTAC